MPRENQVVKIKLYVKSRLLSLKETRRNFGSKWGQEKLLEDSVTLSEIDCYQSMQVIKTLLISAVLQQPRVVNKKKR